MINTYGPLHLSVQVIIGLAVVAILTLLVAMGLFRLEQLLAGLAIIIVSAILVIILLITAWTTFDRMSLSVITIFGAMLGSIVVLAAWIILPILTLFPKQKVVTNSHG